MAEQASAFKVQMRINPATDGGFVVCVGTEYGRDQTGDVYAFTNARDLLERINLQVARLGDARPSQ